MSVKENCVFSLFASDMFDKGKLDIHHSYSYPIISRKCEDPVTLRLPESVSIKQVSLLDKTDNIVYIPLGYVNKIINKSKRSHDIQLFLNTQIIWANTYTCIFWVRFRRNRGIITTFDSSYHAPLFCRNGQIGVTSAYTEETMKDDIPKYDTKKWYYIAVIANGKFGVNTSSIYMGDINTEPQLMDTLDITIANRQTERLGNKNQGPGDVACAIAYDCILSENDIVKCYHQSMNEIKLHWNNNEIKAVNKILHSCLSVNEIVNIIFEYIRHKSLLF